MSIGLPCIYHTDNVSRDRNYELLFHLSLLPHLYVFPKSISISRVCLRWQALKIPIYGCPHLCSSSLYKL